MLLKPLQAPCGDTSGHTETHRNLPFRPASHILLFFCAHKMAKIMPLPAQCLSMRLKIVADEFSSWAAYLPRSSDETSSSSKEAQATLSDFVGTQVTGHVWQLSLRQRGSRAVQEAIELCSTDEEREAIASELAGHIWEAVRCPHANFVVQRLIVALKPSACQFIIDEIMKPGSKSVGYLARHKYGCRTLQRLLEHCSQQQTLPIIEGLLAEVVPLSRHPYGNYVVQQLFEHGNNEQRVCAVQKLVKNVVLVASDCNGGAVLLKAMMNTSKQEQSLLAHAMATESGLVLSIARSRYGHAVAQMVFSALSEPCRSCLARELVAHSEELRASRYGRLLLNSLAGKSATSSEPDDSE